MRYLLIVSCVLAVAGAAATIAPVSAGYALTFGCVGLLFAGIYKLRKLLYG